MIGLAAIALVQAMATPDLRGGVLVAHARARFAAAQPALREWRPAGR